MVNNNCLVAQHQVSKQTLVVLLITTGIPIQLPDICLASVDHYTLQKWKHNFSEFNEDQPQNEGEACGRNNKKRPRTFVLNRPEVE